MNVIGLMKKTLFLIAALALSASACGTAENPNNENELVGERPPESVVLTVSYQGGFVPVEQNLGNSEAFVLTADRTLYAPGPTTFLFPGPLMNPVSPVTISEESFADILGYLTDLGIASVANERIDRSSLGIADAQDTVFTYFDPSGGTHVLSIYALGFEVGDSDLRVLVAESLLSLLESAHRTGVSSTGHPLDSLVVWVGPAFDVDPEFEDIRSWPLPIKYSEMNPGGGEWRCVEFSEEEALSLMGVFEAATSATTWVEGDQTWKIVPRIMFPGTAGCPALP